MGIIRMWATHLPLLTSMTEPPIKFEEFMALSRVLVCDRVLRLLVEALIRPVLLTGCDRRLMLREGPDSELVGCKSVKGGVRQREPSEGRERERREIERQERERREIERERGTTFKCAYIE